MNDVEVKFKLVENGKLPTYATDGAVCMDCYARIYAGEIGLEKGSRCLINLGFAVAIPQGYELVIRPRSGMSKRGLDVSIGTIDTDFRGEVKANVCNNSDGEFKIYNGDRICQIALRPAPTIKPVVVDELDSTERGGNGFGSTGVN